jgi:hypothetical protein
VSEQSEINQTGLQYIITHDLTANIDQSVSKTVIHQPLKVNQPIPFYRCLAVSSANAANKDVCSWARRT